MKRTIGLNDDDLQLLRELLAGVCGIGRLSELFAEAWPYIKHKTAFGIAFKRAVEAGLLAGVRTCGKTVENHQLYYVAA